MSILLIKISRVIFCRRGLIVQWSTTTKSQVCNHVTMMDPELIMFTKCNPQSAFLILTLTVHVWVLTKAKSMNLGESRSILYHLNQMAPTPRTHISSKPTNLKRAETMGIVLHSVRKTTRRPILTLSVITK